MGAGRASALIVASSCIVTVFGCEGAKRATNGYIKGVVVDTTKPLTDQVEQLKEAFSAAKRDAEGFRKKAEELQSQVVAHQNEIKALTDQLNAQKVESAWFWDKLHWFVWTIGLIAILQLFYNPAHRLVAKTLIESKWCPAPRRIL